MPKRTRRTVAEIRSIQNKSLEAVRQEGRITLSELVSLHGAAIGVRDTPSDKHLVKRRLDILARNQEISFVREGQELVARYSPSAEAALPVEAPVTVSGQEEETEAASSASVGADPDLDVVKAYARQLEQFSKTLHQQVTKLVQLVNRVGQARSEKSN